MKKAVTKVVSPLPGLIARVAVKPGQKIKKGEVMVILNVMKTEIPVISETNGIIKEIYVKEWDEVDVNTVLALIEPSNDINKNFST